MTVQVPARATRVNEVHPHPFTKSPRKSSCTACSGRLSLVGHSDMEEGFLLGSRLQCLQLAVGWSAFCQQRTSDGVRLMFGKSIQSGLHYLEGCIHCCLLIAGKLVRQEVSDPHHARSTVLGEGLE